MNGGLGVLAYLKPVLAEILKLKTKTIRVVLRLVRAGGCRV